MWILAVLTLIGLWVLVTYNTLVGLRMRVDNAWSDISVQLKRRYDLIPNVVEAVKGYAAHEQGTLTQVTEARTRAMTAINPKEKEAAETALGSSVKSLFALAESYPDLKANQNFLKLQETLTQIEEALQSARRYYNAVVRDYNTKCQVVPDTFVARAMSFTPRDFFQLDQAGEAANPKVAFS